jgi:hypothetical protein
MEILVKDLLPGTKYILQARAKAPSGITSPWSNTFRVLTESDTVAPMPVTDLTWVVSTSSFTGTWTKPTLDSNGKSLKDFNGYELTLTSGAVSKKFICMQERFTLTFEENVATFGTPGPIINIVVKSRDIVGNLSTPVTATATNPIPANLTNLTATGIPLAISLSWDATVEDDFKCYEVHTSTSPIFTPVAGNLVTRTTSNSFVFPATDIIAHYFKVRQVDVFNQPCPSYLLASATALNTTELNTTPPNAPTAVTVATVPDANGSSSTINVSWTASASTNLAGYVVRFSPDEVSWQYINVPSNKTNVKITGLPPATNYYVAVASISFMSSYSLFVNASVGGYPIATAVDTVAPSTPAIPTVSFNTQMVQVSHSLAKSGGGNLEADVRYLEVHSSITTGFTASSSTLIGTLDCPAQGVTVVGNFPAPVTDSISNMYWRVIAVDYAGNKSAQSFQATGLPGLISGTNIANATITDAKIGSLSATKLVAGTAFINDLSVRSALTLDAATGYIKSTNFDIPTQTGWRLDQNGLVIYSGSIMAKSLMLQNGPNIAPAVFADFEFNTDYYHDVANAPNSLQLTATSGLLMATQFTGQKVGKQAMRVYNTSITGATIHQLHFATGGQTATGVNVDVNPGDYIYSLWAKKNGAVDQNIKLALYTDTGVAIASSNILITSTTMTQYSAVLTVPSGVVKAKMYMELTAVTTGYDIVIDALQLEPKLTAQTLPSAWKPPSTTVIDGGSIITGSIRSSAASATVPGQPAWSINTAGNMQIGDALIRGKLIVGAVNETVNIVAPTYSSFEDAAATYYNVSTNVPAAAKFNVPIGATQFKIIQQTTGSPPQGANALRMFGTGFTAASTPAIIFSAGATPNITVVPGQTYILSAWVKTNDITKNQTFTMGFWTASQGYVHAIPLGYVPTATWTRVYGTVVSTQDKVALFTSIVLGPSETVMDVSIDGVQFEAPPVGVTTPSAWQLGLSGGSAVQSTNYVAGSKGWVINSDGTVEFNAATIRGNLVVTGTAGNIRTNLNGFYPTLFFNSTDGSYSYINAAAGSPSTKAQIGINSASYVNGASHTIRPRMWMPDQIGIELVDETAGILIGGGVSLTDVQAILRNRNSSGVEDASYVAYSGQTFIEASSNYIDAKTGITNIEAWDAGQTTSRGYFRVKQDGLSFHGAATPSTLNWNEYWFATGYFRSGSYPDWINIPFGNGWNSTSIPTLQCRLDANGRVWFRGQAKGGTIGAGPFVIGTVPVNFRPAQTANFCCASDSSPDNRFQVNVTGDIYAWNIQFGNSPIYFDNASYSMN